MAYYECYIVVCFLYVLCCGCCSVLVDFSVSVFVGYTYKGGYVRVCL